MAIANHDKIQGEGVNKLPKLLSPLESLSFGLASHITWLIAAPIVIFYLGFSSTYIWLVGSILAVLNLILVKYIAKDYPETSGGISSYITRLYPENSFIAKYASLGYFIGWVSIPTASTLILSEFVSQIFLVSIDSVPAKLLQIFFIVLISSIGYSSNKVLSIFHTILTIPAVLTTILFTIATLLYLVIFKNSTLDIALLFPPIQFSDFFKYFFLAIIIIFTGDIAASFTADSTKPFETIKNIRWSMFFLPFVYILGTWLLLLIGEGELSLDIYMTSSFIGDSILGMIGLFFSTVWIGSSLFLSCATVIAHAPRIIYQLALDGKLDPALQHVSNKGSLNRAAFFTIFFSILLLFVNDVENLLIIISVPYFISYIVFHAGVLLKKKTKPQTINTISRIILPIEIVCFILGIYLLNPYLVVFGFVLPLLVIAFDKILPQIKIYVKPQIQSFFRKISFFQSVDNTVMIFTQLLLLIVVEVVTILATWFIVLSITQQPLFFKLDNLAFILVVSCFTTIAIAASTVFPQIQNLDVSTKKVAEVNAMLEKDIQRRIIAENALLTMTTHDELTSIGNRKLLSERILFNLKKIKKNSITQFGLLIINLNRFKSINDSLGNKIGDELLKSVAIRLATTVSSENQIYRLGSDEFAVLIPSLQKREHVISITQDILSSFTFPFLVKGRQLFITASVGVNIINKGSLNVDDVLSETNIALLEAKKIGKNRYSFFDKEQYERVLSLLNLETNLPKAIKNKEFELYYQPIVNLQTNKISGYETLVRWAHGDEKLLPPSSFIPLAEETDLVVPLTWQILERACFDVRGFQKHFNNDYLRVNVNFSLKQFFEPDLVKRIIDITNKAELPVSCLKIEITESMLQDSEDLKYVMNELSDNNIKLNLDDFGTGYSSLGYLNTLPISALKIDKSFIRNLNPKSLEITQAMINLAKNIGAWTIVEGIETQKQLNIVKSMGANFGQGYYFGRAMPSDEIINFKYPPKVKD